MDPIWLNNKVALVTGSTAGLGKELAFQLGRGGAKVVLNGRDPEKLQRAAAQAGAYGLETSVVSGDVSDPADCRKILEHCIETYGRLDILVNNAGVGSGGSFERTTPDTFRSVFEVNTLGTIYMTRFALPYLRESGGSVMFISSLAGLIGLPFSSLYSGTKMALTAFAQALQFELMGSGVHVGVAYVGFLKNAPEKRIMGPDGELQPTGDRSSFRLMPMDRASRIIIRAIRKRKNRIVMSFLGKWFYFGQRFTPWLIRLILVYSLGRARKTYEPVDPVPR
jgi:short-subunit dehydrogenase